MKHRSLFLVAGMICLLAASQTILLGQDDAYSDNVKLQLEVDALTTLNDLNLTPDQLTALKGMISDTAGTMSDTPDPVGPDYVAALKDARAALLSKDQDRIDNALDKVGDIDDQLDPDCDPDVDQSEPAKDKAVTLLKMLSVKQVANYVGENSDDMDDPTQMLLDAVHHARDGTDDDFQSLQQDTSEEIGTFFGTSHPGKPLTIVVKVNHLLARVRHLSADDYQSQQSALEDEAKQLVANLDPIVCMRHWMDNELADLLSNPQLGEAIDDLEAK